MEVMKPKRNRSKYDPPKVVNDGSNIDSNRNKYDPPKVVNDFSNIDRNKTGSIKSTWSDVVSSRPSMKTQHYTESKGNVGLASSYDFPQQGEMVINNEPKQVSSSVRREGHESVVKSTNIDTSMSEVPVVSNVGLHSTEVKTKSVGEKKIQGQEVSFTSHLFD